MANDTTTFVGNLTADPQFFRTEGRTPRATFRVAINHRFNDEDKTVFIPVTCFGTLAENVAQSLRKGNRVIVEGRHDSYEREFEIDGEMKSISMLTVTAYSVAPDLRWATAAVKRVQGTAPSAGSADEAVDEVEEVEEKPTRKPARSRAAAKTTAASKKRAAKAEAESDEEYW